MSIKSFIVVCSILVGAATAAKADFDISPGAAGGALNTNAFEDATSTFVGNVRVFHFQLGNDGPFFAQDPGFHPQPGQGIPGGNLLSITIGSPLQFWDGTGPVAFGALANGETLKLQNGSFSLAIGAAAPAGSLNIATTDAFGEFDHHLGSTLMGSGTSDPTDGVYLTSFILHNPNGTLLDSQPFYIIYDNNLTDDQVNEATVAVRDALAPGTNVAGVPEPGSLLIMSVAGLGFLRRRRL
ncbi:MAG: PEP-CTERM sorting domain-containing protein [Tepidisphaerales bacterium]